jgi:hypothetical protein
LPRPFGETRLLSGPCYHWWWDIGLSEMKRQSAQCKFSTSKEISPKSKVKTMLITFFDIRGILHYEFVPSGQNVNQAYYLEPSKDSVKKSGENSTIFLLQSHGSCTSTMRLHTRHCLFESFWRANKLPCSNTLLTHQILSHVIFSCFHW